MKVYQSSRLLRVSKSRYSKQRITYPDFRPVGKGVTPVKVTPFRAGGDGDFLSAFVRSDTLGTPMVIAHGGRSPLRALEPATRHLSRHEWLTSIYGLWVSPTVPSTYLFQLPMELAAVDRVASLTHGQFRPAMKAYALDQARLACHVHTPWWKINDRSARARQVK